MISSFGWVPLLNLALELPRVVERAISTGSGKYEFTEADDFLFFGVAGDLVDIRASYSDVVICVEIGELREAVSFFRKSSLAAAQAEHPELRRNENFLTSFGISDHGR